MVVVHTHADRIDMLSSLAIRKALGKYRGGDSPICIVTGTQYDNNIDWLSFEIIMDPWSFFLCIYVR
jgi:hypothetical protein